MGVTVVLPKEIKPKFPRRCVVCNQPTNNELAEIQGEASGFFGFHKWLFRQSGKLEVPAHKPCSQGLKRRLLWRNIGVLALFTALPIAWFTMRIYEVQMPFEFNKTTLCIASLFIFLPIFIWEEMRPSAFEFREGETSVTYEFKSRDYAEKFEALNEAPEGKYEELLIDKAEDYLLFDKYAEAVEAATEYIELKPRDSIGFEIRGEAYLRLKKFGEALSDLNRSLAIAAKNPNAFRLRATANRILGKFAEARADWQMARALEVDQVISETSEGDEEND